MATLHLDLFKRNTCELYGIVRVVL